MTAVHGDEGDDQHGLKVHEVHDMQPGLPGTSHPINPASGAVGLLPLSVSPSGQRPQPYETVAGQNGREGRPDVQPHSYALQAAAEAQGLNVCKEAPRLPVESNSAEPLRTGETTAADSGQPQDAGAAVDAGLQHSADEPTGEALIDLCSPCGQSHVQQLAKQDEDQLPGGDPEQTLQPCRFGVAEQPAQQLELCLDLAEQVSLSQAGKLDLAELHQLRPAGVTQDPSAHTDQAGHHQSCAEQTAAQPTLLNSQTGTAAEPSSHSGQHQPGVTCLEGSWGAQDPKCSLGPGQQQGPGMHARIKALLRRQDGMNANGAGSGETAEPLTQAEVIEAQTADQEKPLVGLPSLVALLLPLCSPLELLRSVSKCMTSHVCARLLLLCLPLELLWSVFKM